MRFALIVGFMLMLAGCSTMPKTSENVTGSGNTSVANPPPVVAPVVRIVKPKIALVLGGGAARGFAHVGVIKVLEAQGIVPDMVVGTSAGSVVGALYAGGYTGFELQKIAFKLDEDGVGDWVMLDRGFIKGEALQNFINTTLQNKNIENLRKPYAAVATDLQTGEMKVFQRGNTGMAVRASSSVPGVFQPVKINGRDYVDGGLVSPVPVGVARKLGADFVIAVEIGSKPAMRKIDGTKDILLQTFSIMGQRIGQTELLDADIVIRPNTGAIGPADFKQKNDAILEGEQAAQAAIPLIRQKLQTWSASAQLGVQGGERR